MEFHNPKVIGDLTLSQAPTLPDHGVRLQDLDARIQPLKAFATDIVGTGGTGIVAQKVFAPTVPANKILLSAVADTKNVTVQVLGQGGLFTAPVVTINGTAVANWAPSGDANLFAGSVDLVLATSGDITIETEGGATSTVTLTLATEGPVVQTATIGALPGTQTEAKATDVVSITGAVANDAVSMAVSNLGAAASGTIATFGANNSAGAGFKTFAGTFVVANRSGLQNVTVTAKNALGTDGTAVASGNQITLNQTAPTIGAVAINYPNGQTGLKNGDVAAVSSTITNADSVAYAFNAAGQTVSIEDPTVYAVSKNVTLTAGTYNVANNYTITATKASNGAVSTRQASIKIANTAAAATVAVQGNPARLRTDANGETYTLVVTPNQTLSANPDLALGTGASWVGNWVNNSNVFSRTFSVSDATPRGALSVTGTITNLANTASAATGSLTVGGLIERNITFAAFSRKAPIGSNVADISKARARYAGGSTDLTRRADTTDVASAFTIVNEAGVYDPNGGFLFISDSAYAGANTSGTLQLTFEETL